MTSLMLLQFLQMTWTVQFLTEVSPSATPAAIPSLYPCFMHYLFYETALIGLLNYTYNNKKFTATIRENIQKFLFYIKIEQLFSCQSENTELCTVQILTDMC
jgi:hypothetical protein